MPLTPATTLGPYEIIAPLGAGGMGEVYRARDHRLDRDVAVKVLPQALASDPGALARFEREAKAVAALSHPNILSIFDFGTSGTVAYAAMELLDGQTLRDRLAGGALPLRKAIDIALQIAHGLAAAHEKGIIHRDLKPENVFVTADGRVKILDFGLAKAMPAQAAVGAAVGATVAATADQTTPGMVMGTVGYMSPEQITGAPLDHRTDIFAFGAIVYELLAGRRAFKRDSTAETIAAILKEDPPELPSAAALPPALDRIMRRCLEKQPSDRFHSAHDLALALETVSLTSDSAAGSLVASPARRGGVRGRERAVWAAALLLVIAAAAALRLTRPPAPASQVTKLLVAVPSATPIPAFNERRVALSPNGRQLVYTAAPGSSLYVRAIDRLDAVLLDGTQGASNPFFSPDGQWIGFFADGKVKKVPVAGGAALTICDAAIGRGATWGADDTIIFPAGLSSGLLRVSARGGRPQAITKPDPTNERSHRWPHLLPGGKAILFVVQPRGRVSFFDARVVVQSLETGERKTIIEGGTGPVFVDGHIIVARGGSLIAIPFDPSRLEVTGAPTPVLEGVAMMLGTGAAQFAVSGIGSIVYLPGTAVPLDVEVDWVDRRGTATPVENLRRPIDLVTISPDGGRAAVRVVAGDGDIWIYDFRRASLTRLTFNPGPDNNPVWAADGRSVFFAGIRTGPFNIFRKAADGIGDEELLVRSDDSDQPYSVSPDGRWLAFTRQALQTGLDIWILPLDGERKARPFVVTTFAESFPRFSPDGRWLAYVSNESGRFEVYVRQFPGPGGKWQVSTEGGELPVWARNGRELFYREGERVMTVAIEPGDSFAAGTPRELFRGNFQPGYDIAPDGQRFLMIKSGEATTDRHIHWLTGWSRDVAAKTGAKADR